jgi:hypothetical protein
MIKTSRNLAFFFDCFLISTGDANADGVSMAEVAKEWSVTKATVSKQCNFICAYLALPPSRYMRDEGAKESYRAINVRPQKR